VCTEANIVLRAVAADFFFNCSYLAIPSNNCQLSCARSSTGNVPKFLFWKIAINEIVCESQ
jgi:hypothetical protein